MATDPARTPPTDLDDALKDGAGSVRLQAALDALRVVPSNDDGLVGVWRTVDEWGELGGLPWLRSEPPPPRYLLTTKLDANRGLPPRGVLPQGRTGMLAAAGGVGKTFAFISLGVSVATGRDWLGTFEVPEPGHVAMLLGEEEPEELRRRLYYAAQALRLTTAERALAEKNIVAVPLCGRPVTLTAGRDATSGEIDSAFGKEVKRRLATAGHDWSLVLLDPVSRFAGPEVETDNAAATAFVQAIERLTEVPGHPTVLAAHHTNKTSRAGTTTASAARGSSALTDGFRWQANLEAVETQDDNGAPLHGVVFRVVKTNYCPAPEPLWLGRDGNGVLRALTPSERNTLIERLKRKGS